jgi:predicted site-specific integrase-resolvase
VSELLTAGQVAAILGVNRATVWKWRKAGRICGMSIDVPGSRVWGYTKSEVNRIKRELAKQHV